MDNSILLHPAVQSCWVPVNKYLPEIQPEIIEKQKVEKTTPKSCILIAVGRFFFSAASTAQNSPELHFHFINSFIQPSLVGSQISTP